MRNLLDTARNILAPFKLAIILILVVGIGVLGLKVAVPEIQYQRAMQTPVAEIKAVNKKIYLTGSEIKRSDFTIVAVHENGLKTKIDPEEIELSRTSVDPVGKTTKVTLTLTENPSLSCEVDVNIKRDPVKEFHCGYPNLTNVVAVLYSNGELSFEGSGDVMVYDEGDYPWVKYKDKENAIKAVTFSEDVKPTNMNYWFEGMKTITYVDKIPDTVKTMIRTFEGCEALPAMADWSEDKELLDATECYSKCVSLKTTFALPENLRKATKCFADCAELQQTPDMTKAKTATRPFN